MRKIYLQVSTHWDREWYRPYQEFRYRLIGVADKIFDQTTKKEHFRKFFFDGQTIVIENYLGLLPQNREKVADLIREGSIEIGPWYVMPDECLVSGESLIRNFLQGRQVCREFGVKPYPYGYVNDVFGHIAQFPQLMNQIGIHMTYQSRGLSGAGQDMRHFIWEAPDGSQCYGYKCNYADAYEVYGKFLNRKKGNATEEEKDECVRNYIESEFAKCGNGVILLNVTADHIEPTPVIFDFLKRVRALEDVEIVEDGFAFAYDDIAVSQDQLPICKGELITTSQGRDYRLVTDSISSYYTIKKANDHCQNVLEQETASIMACRLIEGNPVRKEFLQTAYKWLLRNHPHDNICGCSCDAVHKNMEYRFAQAQEIADVIRNDFIYSLEENAQGDCANYLLKVYNPFPEKKKRIVTLQLDFVGPYLATFAGNAPFQPKNMFRIFGVDGEEVSYQILSIEHKVPVSRNYYFHRDALAERYTVALEAALTPMGMTEYLVVPVQEYVREKESEKMRSGDTWAENEFVRMEITNDGTIRLSDKVTGKVYEKLHYFLDDAEAGNGWFHEAAGNQDCVITSRYTDCSVEKVRNGRLETTFRVTKRMHVPECMDYDSQSRSDRRVIMEIVSEITLKKDSGKLYVQTKVNNCIKDHRLRLLLPTGIEGDTYYASQAFYFAPRKVGRNAETDSWWEPETLEKHFDGILYKTDEAGNGLAFVGCEGFHQAGVMEDEENTISVVLFRSFGRTQHCGEPMELCQIQGELEFQYVIVPMNGSVDRCELLDTRKYGFRKEMARFTRTDRPIEAQEKNVKTDEKCFRAPLWISGKNVAVSLVKPAEYEENAIVVRVYNTSGEVANMHMEIGIQAEEILETDLYESKIRQIGICENSIDVTINGYGIKTFLIRVRKEDMV